MRRAGHTLTRHATFSLVPVDDHQQRSAQQGFAHHVCTDKLTHACCQSPRCLAAQQQQCEGRITVRTGELSLGRQARLPCKVLSLFAAKLEQPW